MSHQPLPCAHEFSLHNTNRPEDIADYYQARCSCGWKSKEELGKSGPTAAYREHLREVEIAAAEARGAATAYAACAALVRAAGCLCLPLAEADDLHPYFNGRIDQRQDEPVLHHDSRCPLFLAAAIEARVKAPSPEVTHG